MRFNGLEFQLFDWRTSGGLIGWNVYHIEARRDGSLLFSTEGGTGLIELRNGKFSPYPTPVLPNKNVRIFHEGRDGTIWIGTNGPGLIRVKDGNVDFRFGIVSYKDKTEKLRLRAVRGGG